MRFKSNYLRVSGVILFLAMLVFASFNSTNTHAGSGTLAATVAGPSLTPTPSYLPCPAVTMAATAAGTAAASSTVTATATLTSSPSMTSTVGSTQAATTKVGETPIVRPGFFGIRIRRVDNCGLRILAVRSNSTAQKAGLLVDDVIVALDGVKVTRVVELTRLIRNHKTGDSLLFTIQRAGQQMDIEVLLGVLVETSPAATPLVGATVNATMNATEDSLQ